MRRLSFGIVVITCVAGSAAAQAPLQEPLSGPDAAVSGGSQPKKIKIHKKVAHAAKINLPPYAVGNRGTEAKSISHIPVSEDPLSFGMKWNGSNDSAKDSRVQNYNGNAQGSGAEVGMKLHF